MEGGCMIYYMVQSLEQAVADRDLGRISTITLSDIGSLNGMAEKAAYHLFYDLEQRQRALVSWNQFLLLRGEN
jgi:hypothetical protein